MGICNLNDENGARKKNKRGFRIAIAAGANGTFHLDKSKLLLEFGMAAFGSGF